MIPGEVFINPKLNDIKLNQGKLVQSLKVANLGDRPIQVGSHYHFYEANEALDFDRDKAYGYRLNIPAGMAVRFEPGQSRTVNLVTFSGNQKIYGFAGKVMGYLNKLKE